MTKTTCRFSSKFAHDRLPRTVSLAFGLRPREADRQALAPSRWSRTRASTVDPAIPLQPREAPWPSRFPTCPSPRTRSPPTCPPRRSTSSRQASQGLCRQDQRHARRARASKDASLIEVIKAAKDKGDKSLFNNSAQIWNHSFFWQCLAPDGSTAAFGQAQGNDRRATSASTDALLEKLATESADHFASGWGWLVLNNGKLEITSLHDADTPVGPRHDAAADARCVGTCLLHRLSQRAPALPQDRCSTTSSTGTSSRKNLDGRGRAAPTRSSGKRRGRRRRYCLRR